MSRANLALVVGSGSDRAALAAAIAGLTEAARDLAATRQAVEEATEAHWAAEEELEKLTNPEEGNDADERGAAFIASVKAGKPADVEDLGGAVAGSERAIAKAERAIETWKKRGSRARRRCRKRRSAVSRAKHAVDEAAVGVMRDANLVGPLLAGLAELSEEFFQRRLLLHFLACHGLVSEARQADVKAALAPLPLPGNPEDVFYREWYARPDYAAWKDALEALRRDAEAHIPGVS